jgi:hypothetical protein
MIEAIQHSNQSAESIIFLNNGLGDRDFGKFLAGMGEDKKKET